MTAPRPNTNQQILQDVLAEYQETITAQFPSYAAAITKELEHHRRAAETPLLTTARSAQTSQETDVVRNEITREEHEQVLQKLRAMITFPQDHTEEEKLYLEQQLSDQLGFAISTELDNHKLPHQIATLQVATKWQSKPSAENPQAYEASQGKRSFFGWFSDPTLSNDFLSLAPQYGISLPLHLTDQWQEDPIAARDWFRYKQVLLINPLESTAVVCALADVYTASLTRYQGAVSPTVIKAAKLWSVSSQGNALLYFIDSPLPVSFKSYSLAWKETHTNA